MGFASSKHDSPPPITFEHPVHLCHAAYDYTQITVLEERKIQSQPGASTYDQQHRNTYRYYYIRAVSSISHLLSSRNKMLALMSTAKPAFLEIDNDKFKTIMKISSEDEIEQRKDRSGKDEDASKTLQLLRIKGFPRLLPEGIQALVNYCRYLRELCLSYSFLSDELLLALSSEKQMELETLRLEAHQEIKPLPRVSDTAWCTFSSHLPNINLVLSTYMTNEDDQSQLLAPYVPITHLYFGEAPSEATLLRIGCVCSRLVEIVIAAYGSNTLDRALLSIAEGCSHLNAVGLGDCEITCSGLLEFVTICAKRLQILYIWETSLIEDSEFDVTKVSNKISLLLGRTWVPEYIPLC